MEMAVCPGLGREVHTRAWKSVNGVNDLHDEEGKSLSILVGLSDKEKYLGVLG